METSIYNQEGKKAGSIKLPEEIFGLSWNSDMVNQVSKKFKNGEVLFVDKVNFAAPKTTDAKKTIGAFATIKGFEKLSTKKANTMYLALSEKNDNVRKSFNNFGNVAVEELRNINPLVLAQYKYVVITNPEQNIKLLAPKK